MGIFLAEDCHKNIRARDLFLPVRGGLHMHDRPLNNTLKAQRGLGINIIRPLNNRRVVRDKLRQGLAQVIDIRGTGLENLGSGWVVE
jgi:hypothetical protein